jgi:hypothetical protein
MHLILGSWTPRICIVVFIGMLVMNTDIYIGYISIYIYMYIYIHIYIDILYERVHIYNIVKLKFICMEQFLHFE